MLWKRWCLLGLPVMPKTPRVAPPALALRATTAEADRATTAAEAIPFMPAKLHKTIRHIHHCLLPIIPCHYTHKTYHTPLTIYQPLVFVFVFRKETKFVNKILFPKKTKCHIKPWLADRLTMDELRFRIINQVFVWEKEMKKFLMVFGFMNLFHWILNLAFLNLQILFKYPTWRISSIILSENFFSSSSHFKSFFKSLSQSKNKSVKESKKNQNGALYKKKLKKIFDRTILVC